MVQANPPTLFRAIECIRFSSVYLFLPHVLFSNWRKPREQRNNREGFVSFLAPGTGNPGDERGNLQHGPANPQHEAENLELQPRNPDRGPGNPGNPSAPPRNLDLFSLLGQ